jgi:hypothetical protein
VYLYAPGRLWASPDAGRSWQRLTTPCRWPGANGAALAAWSASRLALACGGEPGAGNQAKTFHVSTDGAANWRLTGRIGMRPGYVTSLAAGGPHTWALAEARGTIEISRDGGRSWRGATFADPRAAVEGWGNVAFIDPTHAVAVPWTLNGAVLALTGDGVRRWTEVSFGS